MDNLVGVRSITTPLVLIASTEFNSLDFSGQLINLTSRLSSSMSFDDLAQYPQSLIQNQCLPFYQLIKFDTTSPPPRFIVPTHLYLNKRLKVTSLKVSVHHSCPPQIVSFVSGEFKIVFILFRSVMSVKILKCLSFWFVTIN